MIIGAIVALLFAAPAPAPAPAGVTMVMREHLVVRVPLPRRAPPPPMTVWKERKGPHCIALADIAGAAVAAPDSVDLVMRGGNRLRARLNRACPALDFYSGFYLVAMPDGRICGDRDAIHTRAGGACEIERFRLLKPDG